MQENNTPNNNNTTNSIRQMASIKDMYQDWFLDYASYVILERAIAHVDDGLKPVQRRILHSMYELDDGRYNKVANIVGNTMKYHPHGDASIGDAITNLGQKELLIDTQGNWGNILTGDRAAAPRYIEARLSKFALEVAFNYRTTSFHPSYDGRNKEPDVLPIKFPLLLAQGAKGIAVGLSCEILPHNFNELLDSSIAILKNKPFELYPDFITGGEIDVSEYNDGMRSGKILIRAKIVQEDAKTLIIKQIPYSTTADSIIDSIVKATETGKLKIKKIENNTAREVEIRIQLPNDINASQAIDALYAFTDCQISISPNCCVIQDNKPCFMTVSQILKINTQNTVNLLKKELELSLNDLYEKLQWISLEKIFIENEIYEQIKPCTTDQSINSTIYKGLEPFVKSLVRPVNDEDIQNLRKIRIDRISKFNSDKANELLKEIQSEIEKVKNNLANIIDYTINWFKHLKTKYGKDKGRKTTICSFHKIEITQVVATTEKLYCNKKEGFAGYKLKSTESEFIADCSKIDDIIVVHQDGTYIIKRVQEKDFVGKDIIHIAIFKKQDSRTIYNIMYNHGPFGRCYAKRCAIMGVIRDKQYDFTQGVKGSKLMYFSVNPNGEAEQVTVWLKASAKMRRQSLVYDFASLDIKSRSAHGNIVDNCIVRKVEKKSSGQSTLSAQEFYLDKDSMQINTIQKGEKLGSFWANDKIIIISNEGYYKILPIENNMHIVDKCLKVEKYNNKKPITIIYWDNIDMAYYIKRFLPEDSSNERNLFLDKDNCIIKMCLTCFLPIIKIDDSIQEVSQICPITKPKAKGKKLTFDKKAKFSFVKELPYNEQFEKNLKPTLPNSLLKDGQTTLF